ncbi:MAG: hypothetical protein KBE22_00175 [Candidatus Accumulibacter sp.]|nr:hypothetical protein [Accumulibacter sp.]
MSNVSTQDSALRYGAVTKSDTTVLQFKRLYIGGTGAVAIKNGADQTAVVFAALPVGSVINAVGTHVMSTGTTATNIVWMDW